MPDSKKPANVITMPRLGANDDNARLVGWLVEAGSQVAAGQEICEVETSKAVSGIVSPSPGYVTPLVESGATVMVNDALAFVSQEADIDRTAVLTEHKRRLQTSTPSTASQSEASSGKATKKAEILARRYGIDLASVTASAVDGVIREQDVEAAHTNIPPAIAQSRRPHPSVERVAIIGSVLGGGAAIVADIMLRSGTQLPVAIFDRDTETHGSFVLGVPVLGSSKLENIKRLYESGAFDTAIIALNRNLTDRAALFAEIDRAGIPITNAIDAHAEIRTGVTIGRGNVIAALCYLGAQSSIGDNNFLSSRTTIEHHCVIGSHCGFGPGVTFSGRVKVGNLVRFGTQIAAEPGIEIGDRSIIASSCVLTNNVEPDAVVKAQVAHRTGVPSSHA